MLRNFIDNSCTLDPQVPKSIIVRSTPVEYSRHRITPLPRRLLILRPPNTHTDGHGSQGHRIVRALSATGAALVEPTVQFYLPSWTVMWRDIQSAFSPSIPENYRNSCVWLGEISGALLLSYYIYVLDVRSI